MTEKSTVDTKHPRAESLRVRERLVEETKTGAVSVSGLIAHGRGEAFDYLIGERTLPSTRKAIRAAAAKLLLAKHPVISVNGNAAALTPKDFVALSQVTGAKIEVNLYHRIPGREQAIEKILRQAGANEILGLDDAAAASIPEIQSDRRRVDSNGILIADTVLVPLEDGDRTEALVRMGKTVIAVDLNPLSRTAQYASITIVDNLLRAAPLLVKEAQALKRLRKEQLQEILSKYSNKQVLSSSIKAVLKRLRELAGKGIYLSLPKL